ncbi:LysR family transcriptional regulator [Paralcaligenes ureilyticus]|uniref:LysR family transcriptional regulator n=1 Tax=Paralcaligenes ureilyticus TaxID=627131 RepID=UPI001FB796B1|nr:LysR family transcriptional regulator [Paralcaligenes ureilyticus]
MAECGNFIAASLTLNMSQPALTRTVQRVEQQIGVALFRRSTRHVEITPAGQEFVAVALRILDDLRISLTNMREIADEQRGQVIVSAVMSVAHTSLARMVARYRTDRQGVEVHIREGLHGTVLEDVRSGIADLGITYIDEVHPALDCIPLGSEALHVVLPVGHPLAGQRGIPFIKLRGLQLVSLPRESRIRRIADLAATSAGFSLMHSVSVTQFATLIQFVLAGVGIAIVPGGALPEALSAGLAARPIVQPSISRELGVITLRNRSLAPAASSFLDLIRQQWPASERKRGKGKRS